jgi:hypothetical protein
VFTPVFATFGQERRPAPPSPGGLFDVGQVGGEFHSADRDADAGSRLRFLEPVPTGLIEKSGLDLPRLSGSPFDEIDGTDETDEQTTTGPRLISGVRLFFSADDDDRN